MTVPCFMIMSVFRLLFMCMLMSVTVNMTMFMAVLMLMIMSVVMVMLMDMIVIVVVLVLMIMDMLMLMFMSVLIFVPVGMPVPVHRFIRIVSNHTDPCPGDAVTLVPRDLQSPPLHIQFLQAALQHFTADTQVKHRPQVHVSADSGKAVVIQYLHSVFSFFNTSTAGRTVAHVRILRLLI